MVAGGHPGYYFYCESSILQCSGDIVQMRVMHFYGLLPLWKFNGMEEWEVFWHRERERKYRLFRRVLQAFTDQEQGYWDEVDLTSWRTMYADD